MSVETEQVESQEEVATEIESAVEQEQAPESDAAFSAGFAEATGNAEAVEPEQADPEPEPTRLIAGYTEDEIKALLTKAQEVDRLKEREAKVFGTLGSLKQTIDSMRNQQASPVQLTKDKFKRLASEFPEMAEMLAEDLSGLSLPQGGFDAGAVERVVSEQLGQVQKVNEAKILTVMHPDWRNIVREPEFETWKGSLSQEAQKVLNDGWDAISIGEGLSAFKEWKSKTTVQQSTKRERLESAIAPKSATRTAPVQTADDAFRSGFQSVRGKR